MNHTPERPQVPVEPPKAKPVTCGWCVSTHIADIRCTCEEPCVDKNGKSVGWCTAIDRSDPFGVQFL